MFTYIILICRALNTVFSLFFHFLFSKIYFLFFHSSFLNFCNSGSEEVCIINNFIFPFLCPSPSKGRELWNVLYYDIYICVTNSWYTENYSKEPGFRSYKSRHCAYIIHSVKTQSKLRESAGIAHFIKPYRDPVHW